MLRGKFKTQRALRGALARTVSTVACASLLTVGARPAAEPIITPLTVCEVLRALPDGDGKDALVLGRYSFRPNGRWIGEESCEPVGVKPPELWLMEDAQHAPQIPEPFEMDSAALGKKLAEVKRRTSLGKFPFGSPGYDRWALIYGRVSLRKGDDAKIAPANLLFRGSGVVIVLPE